MSQLRRRISPSVPFILKFEDETGAYEQSFRLAYDLNTITLVEEHLGKSLLTDLKEILDSPTAKSTSILFWAALQINHPEYAGEDGLATVRSNLTLGTARDAAAASIEAFMSQLPVEQYKRMKAMQKGEAPKDGATASPLVAEPTNQ